VEAPGTTWVPVAILVLVYLALVVRLMLLIDRYAVDVFHWDQWDFLDGLFHPRSFWQLFRWQLGPHRMGLGLPLMVAVEQMTDWNAVAISYLNAAVMAAGGLLAVVLKHRLAPPLRWTDAALLFLFLNSSQWAIFVATPNVSHGPLPLLLVTFFAILLTIQSTPSRVVLLLLVDLLATYTGFGIFLGWITPLVILLQWWRTDLKGTAAVLALLASVAILASFFYDYRLPWDLARSCVGTAADNSWRKRLGFFFLLFARAFGATRRASFWAVFGGAVGAAVCWLFLVRSVQLLKRPSSVERLVEVTWVLAAFTLMFAIVASAGRSCRGAGGALNSRYVPYMVPGMVALYLSTVGVLDRGTPLPRRLLAYGVLLAYLGLDVSVRSVDYRQMRYYQASKESWVRCFLKEHDARACTETAAFGIYPDPRAAGLLDKLAIMERRRLGFFAGH
jgi:hypothetical protein